MYSESRATSGGLPISEQFADILQSDIVEYIESLRALDNPTVVEALQNARSRMLDEGVLQRARVANSLGELVAVDGGNNILSTGAGTHCFVLSVRYSTRLNYDVHFAMERLNFESDEPSALMYGVRNALEVRDVCEANEQESFCIVDNSWVSLLQNVNRSLVHYRSTSIHDRNILERFLRPMLSHRGHFITALCHSRNIAISKGGISSFYCNKYGNGVINLSDKVFLLGILEAGEYTIPTPIVRSGQGQLNTHTDELFACQQDIHTFYNSDLNSTGGCICSTYFKPHPWSPVKRIEFHRDLLRQDSSLFFQMLATIQESMTIPTIQEPLEQFLVDQIVKRHTGRIPDLYQTAGIANIRDFNSPFAIQLVRGLRT